MGIFKFFGKVFRKKFKDLIQKSVRGPVSSVLVDLNSEIHATAQETAHYGGWVMSKTQRDKAKNFLETWKEGQIDKIEKKYQYTTNPNDIMRKQKEIQNIKNRYDEQQTSLNKRITEPIELETREERERNQKSFQTRYPDGIFKSKRILWDDFYTLFEINLHNRLNRIVVEYRPKDLIILAMDGVPPQAKIVQQRSRRFRGDYHKNKFNSSLITPGTDFMDRVDEMINRWLSSESKKEIISSEGDKRNGVIAHVRRVIYSSQYIPGEGEHKIMNFIRNGYLIGEYQHIVLGMDADLVMLSLLAPVEHLILVRELSPFNLHYIPKQVIEIGRLRERISFLGMSVEDFVLINTLMGNDFLPHHPTLSDYDTNLEILIKARNTLNVEGKFVNIIEKGEIVWDRFYRFIAALVETGPLLLEKDISKSYDFRKRVFYAPGVVNTKNVATGTINTLNFTKFRDVWYSNEFGPRSINEEDKELYSLLMSNVNTSESNLGENYESSLSGTSSGENYVDLQDVNDMCKHYLVGLVWVFNYYTNGDTAIRWDWYYPYYHAPLFIDLRDKLEQTSRRLVPIIGWEPTSGSERIREEFLPIQQLISVIPNQGDYMIPKLFRAKRRKIIPDYLPTKYLNEKDGLNGNRQVWDPTSNQYRIVYGDEYASILIIPFVDSNRIVSGIKISSEMRDKYLYEPNIEPKTRRSFIIKEIADEMRPRKNNRGRGGGRGRGRGRGEMRGISSNRSNRGGDSKITTTEIKGNGNKRGISAKGRGNSWGRYRTYTRGRGIKRGISSGNWGQKQF